MLFILISKFFGAPESLHPGPVPRSPHLGPDSGRKARDLPEGTVVLARGNRSTCVFRLCPPPYSPSASTASPVPPNEGELVE